MADTRGPASPPSAAADVRVALSSPAKQVFPALTPAQMARVAAHGCIRSVATGEVLASAGRPVESLFVVRAGSIEFVRHGTSGEEVIVVLRPGHFTGETSMLSGRQALVDLKAGEAGELIEVKRGDLLSLVQTDIELGDIFMTAFLRRRVELIAHGFGDVVVIGPNFCQGTLRVKDFLTRNGHPYAFIDLERDPDVQELLDRFAIRDGDVPVLTCRQEVVLRNPTNREIDDGPRLPARTVVVVGGGNSARQAVVFLTQTAKRVYLLVRAAGLAQSMSHYLIRRIEDNPAVRFLPQTEIVALEGTNHLERASWRDNRTGEVTTRAIRHVFSMTGAIPSTGWLDHCVALDADGFIKTGPDLSRQDLAAVRWLYCYPDDSIREY